MRQFGNFIIIAPSFRVSSITNNNMVMKSGYTADKFFTRNEVEPSEDANRKSAGILYNFKLSVAVDKLTADQKNFYGNNAPVICSILDAATAARVIIGTPTSPAIITFIPGVDHDQLVIERASKTPVL